jgi:hypothetical protein
MPMPALLRKRYHTIMRHRRAGLRASELLAAGADRSDPELDAAIEAFSRSWVELRAIDEALRAQGVREKSPRICRPRGKALWSDCYSAAVPGR